MLIIDFGLFKLVRLFDKTMENVCSFDFIFECYPNRNFSLFSVFYFYFSSFGHADIELLLLFDTYIISIYILKMFSVVWVLF